MLGATSTALSPTNSGPLLLGAASSKVTALDGIGSHSLLAHEAGRNGSEHDSSDVLKQRQSNLCCEVVLLLRRRSIGCWPLPRLDRRWHVTAPQRIRLINSTKSGASSCRHVASNQNRTLDLKLRTCKCTLIIRNYSFERT